MEPPSTIDCLVSGDAGEPDDVLAGLTDDQLERLAVALQEHTRAADAWLLHAVAELDRRAIPERAHVLTTRQWVKRFCRQTPTAASATVQAARSLRAMPNVAQRSAAGEIPTASIRLLARVNASHGDDFPAHEETFADIATYLDARDLRRAVDHWRGQVDHPAAIHEMAHRRERRRLAVNQTIDGMWHVDGLLDPESGQTISTALRTHADPGNLDPDDPRAYRQRMADALVDVCRFAMDHGEGVVTSGGRKPHLTVTVSHDQLIDADGIDSPFPEIGGVAIDHETVRRVACDAGIVRIVARPGGEILDVGREQRTVTPAIRRALDHRDGGCRWDGCDRPAGWCDAHHLQHWALGGDTSLANMVLLCRRHHTAIHDGIDRITDRAPP